MYRSRAITARPPAILPAQRNTLEVKIRVGLADSAFLDVAGATWLGDRYFTGGEAFSQPDSQIGYREGCRRSQYRFDVAPGAAGSDNKRSHLRTRGATPKSDAKKY